MATKEYICGSCGAKARQSVSRFKVEHPARDEWGRFIYETRKDKDTGVEKTFQKMVSVSARGLGTWHCPRGCQMRVDTHIKATVDKIGKVTQTVLPRLRSIEVKAQKKAPKEKHVAA